MKHVSANVHFDEGDRFQVQELEGCNGVVSVRCGDVVGVSVYFQSTEEAARVLLHALAQLSAIEDAREPLVKCEGCSMNPEDGEPCAECAEVNSDAS